MGKRKNFRSSKLWSLTVLLLLLFLLGFAGSYLVYRIRNRNASVAFAGDPQNAVATDNAASSVYVNTIYTGPIVQGDDPVDWEVFKAMQDEVTGYLNRNNLYMLLEIRGDRNELWKWNADQANNGLSSIKIFVLVATYQRLAEGTLTRDTIVARYGYRGTVTQALKDMVQISSNEATGALILAVGGVEAVNTIIQNYLGADMTFQLAHTPGYAEGGSNRVTMDEEVELMYQMQQGQVVSETASSEMLTLMSGTADFFGLRAISEIEQIYQKTAYNPPIQYGVVAKIDNVSGRTFLVALQIWGKKGGGIEKSSVRDILRIINKYFS